MVVRKRDHNRNGMCEYGATDGTLEAAAWESGMDNAIRFDGAVMLKTKATRMPGVWIRECGLERLSGTGMQTAEEILQPAEDTFRRTGLQ